MVKPKYDFTAAQAQNKADEQRKGDKALGKPVDPAQQEQENPAAVTAVQQEVTEKKLADMTAKELLALAAKKGIKVNQRTRKADIIKAIETGVSPVVEDTSKPGPKTGTKRGQYNLGVERKVASVSVPLTQREVDAIEKRIKEDGVQRSVLIRNAIDAYLGL